MITKQRVVMHHSLFAAAACDLELFTEVLDEPGNGNARALTVALADYLDMGSPETITVTIEPGDLLNDDPISR